MKVRCCIPPLGSLQCWDCPLTTPLYGEGTKPCICHRIPHTDACMKDESWRHDPQLYDDKRFAAGVSVKDKT
jgi:hypothetical protein